MKKTLSLLLFLPLFGLAQNSTAFWEIGGYVGGLNYKGEITQEGDVGTWINEMRPEFGLVLKRNFNSIFSLGAEAGYGSVYAADANHGMPERDYIVNTELVQANMIAEINFKKFGKFFKRNQNTPYVKTGIGLLFFSPTLNDNAEYDATEYELYWGSFTTYNFQLGLGWKWRLSYNSILALGLHWHSAGTSYLEGFNLKEGVNPNDAYYGLRLTYTYGIF